MRNHTTYDFFFNIMQSNSNFFIHLGIFNQEMLHSFCINISNMRITIKLIRITCSFIKTIFRIVTNCRHQFLRNRKELSFPFFLTTFIADFILEFNYTFYLLMTKENSIQNNFFWQFISSGLNHHNSVIRTRDGKIQCRNFALFFRWINDKFIIYPSYPNTSNWSIKWYI